MIADADFGLLREERTAERTRPHRRVNLFTIGDERVAGQRVVVLPARQLADAPDGAVDGRQTGGVTTSPDHSFVEGGQDLAPTLQQSAVGVEEQLRVVERATIALGHADGHHDSRLPCRVGNGVDLGRRYRHRLVDQPQMFCIELERSLHKGEVGVVRHDRLGERRELNIVTTEFGDLVDDLLDCALTAV